MKTDTKYQPRVVRGRVELYVPHKEKEVAFAFPAHGPNYYTEVGKSILSSKQEVPTGDLTASLLHSSYCDDSIREEPEFQNVRELMKSRWLWVFNRNLWTPQGVYVVQDDKAIGRSKDLDEAQLEKMLKGGEELAFGGIRFSPDRKIRFAPKQSYKLGDHTAQSLETDGFMIASVGIEGARKLGEVSSTFKSAPYTYGVEVKEGQNAEQRLSAVDGDDGRFGFDGGDWVDGNWCHGFGVWS